MPRQPGTDAEHKGESRVLGGPALCCCVTSGLRDQALCAADAAAGRSGHPM